jgi:hypothetical protein
MNWILSELLIAASCEQLVIRAFLVGLDNFKILTSTYHTEVCPNCSM